MATDRKNTDRNNTVRTNNVIQEFELEDGSRIEIELAATTQGNERIASAGSGIKKFSEALANVKPLTRELLGSLSELNQPDEIEVSFGLKMGGKTGVIFASIDSEATFGLKLKWSNKS